MWHYIEHMEEYGIGSLQEESALLCKQDHFGAQCEKGNELLRTNKDLKKRK